MAISDKTRKTLWGKSGNKCAWCRDILITKTSPPAELTIIGEECHIVARNSLGPRGSSELDISKRDDFDNLILLCSIHHKIVDDNPDEYSIEKLHEMKVRHEEWVAAELTDLAPWKSQITSVYYVNIPRLSAFAGLCDISFDYTELGKVQNLHSLGLELVGVMNFYHQGLVASGNTIDRH